MSERRSYGQFCGLAAGLDLLGERWTLLIVRELLLGPARFGDLLTNLPGIGPNLLSVRLRYLTETGVVDVQRTERDGRGREYHLTSRGELLRAPILLLARWGLEELRSSRKERAESRAAWSLIAVQAMIFGASVPPVEEEYEFRVGDEWFHIALSDGQASVVRGPATTPAIVVATDVQTFVEIGARLLTPFAAVVSGRLKVEGDLAAVERCTKLMGLEEPAAAPTYRDSA